jgi:5-methyltetrahydrofolate--homocysteine methyltransferase
MGTQSLLTKSISQLNAQESLDQLKIRITQGDNPQTILLECRQGIEEAGKKFEAREYFLAELMFAANIFKRMMDILGPELTKTMKMDRMGRVLIATVKNDIHDIGKNLVAAMLSAAGFEVTDLGINVYPDMICKKIVENNVDIVALSCLLTSTIDSMEETIAEIDRAGLRKKVKIIVGGNPLSAELATKMGADAYGHDAFQGVVKCRELMEGRIRG